MSFGIYCRPVPRERPPAIDLPVGLKYKLAPRYFDHDGSCRGQIVLDRGSLPYLDGLADGGVDGAQQLIDLIRAHDAVELWIGDFDDR